MYLDYRDNKDFIGMDMCKFLEMGFTRVEDINHHSGQKYDSCGKIKPQEDDWDTCEYRICRIFKKVRDLTLTMIHIRR